MITGIKKTVMTQDGEKFTGCFYCKHCKDTNHSYICGLTGEKLEGWTTLEDKLSDNRNELLKRNILVGVGNDCPLAVVNEKKLTKVTYTVPLETIEEFVEENSFEVSTDIDDEDGKEKLFLRVFIYDDGYENDRDYKLDALDDIVCEIEERFNVKIEEGESDDDCEEVIVTSL